MTTKKPAPARKPPEAYEHPRTQAQVRQWLGLPDSHQVTEVKVAGGVVTVHTYVVPPED